MTIFVESLKAFGQKTAIITSDGDCISYEQLADRVERFCNHLGSKRRLLLIECRNEVEPLVAYLAALRGRHPVMLISEGSQDLIRSIYEAYMPDFVYSKQDGQWDLKCQDIGGGFHKELGLLLSTSGSTGTSKFVRLSYKNIQANAESIVAYLGINDTDHAVTTLPFQYSYGLSVVNTHLMMGATLLLTDISLTEPKFWEFFKTNNATSFAGVPYSFDLLDKIGFEDFDLPSLKYVTQAGGRLAPDRVLKYAWISKRNHWSFFVMYGQTEATARMSYVPPHILENHVECIGIPIPGGEFKIIDEKGYLIQKADTPGELIYTGPNVMMGYSKSRYDLANGYEYTELITGDIACTNKDGLYYLVGRKNRFIKIFGLRISLQEVEDQLSMRGIRAVCTGYDEKLVIATVEIGMNSSIKEMISDWIKLPQHVIDVYELAEYPLLASGKIDYASILKNTEESSKGISGQSLSKKARSPLERIKCLFQWSSSDASYPIRKAFTKALGNYEIKPDDTFVSLGGDSLSYIQVFMAIEKNLGYVPENWQNITVAELERLEDRKTVITHIDVTILLRTLSIILIVANDTRLFGLFDIVGGTSVLMAIAGFNFAKFQASSISTLNSIRPIMSVVKRILLPYLVFVFIRQFYTGDYTFSRLLMYSNFIMTGDTWRYWFIEVLIQTYLIMILLFSFKTIRLFSRINPYTFGIMMLGVSVFFDLIGHIVYTKHLAFVPYKWIWLFALGWCIYFGDTVPKKIINTLLLVLLAFTLYSLHDYRFYLQNSRMWVSLFGIIVLIWIHRVTILWPLNKITTMIGAASLYIYLVHGSCASVFRALVHYDCKLLVVASGLVGGVVFWFLADNLFSYIGHKKYKKKRDQEEHIC